MWKNLEKAALQSARSSVGVYLSSLTGSPQPNSPPTPSKSSRLETPFARSRIVSSRRVLVCYKSSCSISWFETRETRLIVSELKGIVMLLLRGRGSKAVISSSSASLSKSLSIALAPVVTLEVRPCSDRTGLKSELDTLSSQFSESLAASDASYWITFLTLFCGEAL